MRTSPGQVFSAPVGQNAVGDSRLVQIEHLGDDAYRITVRAPENFRGYWLDFSRETPSTELVLQPPAAEAEGAVDGGPTGAEEAGGPAA